MVKAYTGRAEHFYLLTDWQVQADNDWDYMICFEGANSSLSIQGNVADQPSNNETIQKREVSLSITSLSQSGAASLGIYWTYYTTVTRDHGKQ